MVIGHDAYQNHGFETHHTWLTKGPVGILSMSFFGANIKKGFGWNAISVRRRNLVSKSGLMIKHFHKGDVTPTHCRTGQYGSIDTDVLYTSNNMQCTLIYNYFVQLSIVPLDSTIQSIRFLALILQVESCQRKGVWESLKEGHAAVEIWLKRSL